MFDKKLQLRDKMEGSYLIQRLQKPMNFDNPFSFGGGYKNGGLSDNAMKLIRPIFSFDYMGAAEFEFGAVPQALEFLVEQRKINNLEAGEVHLGKRGDTVYYISPIPYIEEVKKRISQLYTEKNIRLKEWCGLHEFFDEKQSRFSQKNLGWLELDNGFMFFVDKEMFEKMCELLNLK